MKVLVVDGDKESRELLSEVLTASGYQVGTVEDGSAAQAELNRDREYRIVIADVRMPNASGLDLLRDLRQKNTKHAMILMSSFVSATERSLAKQLGVHALLEKPFRLSELVDAVAELARKPIAVSREA